MSLPSNLTLVWVRGELLKSDGTPQRGRVTFIPDTATWLDLDTRQTFDTYPFVAVLDAEGKFAVELPATNDPSVQPVGWTYEVREPVRRAYHIAVPYDTSTLVAPGDDLAGERVLELSSAVALPAANVGTVQVVGPTDEQLDAVVGAYLTAHPPGEEALGVHIADATPHPAYDDLPSLSVLFENGLV